MLRLVLPKGSLENATFDLFAAADLAVHRASDVDYRATIDDPRVDQVHILRPQEIPLYVAEGLFDLGVTGRDWVEETGADVVSLGELRYSKATTEPIKLVLAVDAESAVQKAGDLAEGCRISTEYPRLTRSFLAERGVEADVRYSFGATEAKVPGIADAIVELTETGRALRAAGLRVIDTLLTSYTELVANRAATEDPDKSAMGQLLVLLQGALEARGKVLVKLNVSPTDLPGIIAVLPSMRSPTVAKLFGDDGYTVEAVVLKSEINVLIPELKERGRPTSSRSRSPRSCIDGFSGGLELHREPRDCRHEARRVEEFDAERGLGVVIADSGSSLGFHSTAIADGSRKIAVGRSVSFSVAAGLGGRYEAASIRPV